MLFYYTLGVYVICVWRTRLISFGGYIEADVGLIWIKPSLRFSNFREISQWTRLDRCVGQGGPHNASLKNMYVVSSSYYYYSLLHYIYLFYFQRFNNMMDNAKLSIHMVKFTFSFVYLISENFISEFFINLGIEMIRDYWLKYQDIRVDIKKKRLNQKLFLWILKMNRLTFTVIRGLYYIKRRKKIKRQGNNEKN